MQRDIMEGRPSELEAQTGAAVRLWQATGVATPLNTFTDGRLGFNGPKFDKKPCIPVCLLVTLSNISTVVETMGTCNMKNRLKSLFIRIV
jgi:hypothetical protein